MFIPAGRMFFGAQRPRLLTRAICLYIDPYTVPVDPDFRFPEAELQPRLATIAATSNDGAAHGSDAAADGWISLDK